MAVTVKGTEGVSKVEATGSPSASTFLRGDYAWEAPAGGGMTLLDTLTTTSGTSHVASGLDLSTYKTIQVYLYNVGGNSAVYSNIQWKETGGTARKISSNVDAGANAYGSIEHQLSEGITSIVQASFTADTTSADRTGSAGGVGLNAEIDAATTSITFEWTDGATFDDGQITIYGVK